MTQFIPTNIKGLIVLILFVALNACNGVNEDALWQGYIEGDFVYISSPVGGQLQEIMVRKGQIVTAEQPLFTLERNLEQAALAEAAGNLSMAANQLADMRKGLRPSEIAHIEARLEKAKAAEALAALVYKRRDKLYQSRSISEEDREKALTEFELARQQVNEINSELQTGTLGSRPDLIKAAESARDTAIARMDQARWAYEQKAQSAPRPGLIFDVIHFEGEFVPAGRPVISILPPENRKVRFYVPETIVGSFKLGEELLLNFDGLADPLKIKLSYISPEAEYTPPIIYSSNSRAKLVFMLEGRPSAENALLLKPGQPVDISRHADNFIRSRPRFFSFQH